MRILSIGTDRKLLEEGSVVRLRQGAYAEELGALDCVIFSGPEAQEIVEGPLRIMPTRSPSRAWYGWDALRIARSLPRPDVLTAQDPFETGLAGWLIARVLGVPFHVQLHTDPWAPGFARHSFRNRVRRFIAPFILRRAVGVRVVSEGIAEKAEAHGVRAPITVLPIFTDMARLEDLPRTKHPRWKIALLFVGRLEKEKGVDRALDALAHARASGHDVGLTIVGSGSEEHDLRNQAQILELAGAVSFVGWQDDITPYLSEADLVLVPSRYEGYGLVIVEALTAGVPVLASDVGIAREAGAIVVPPKEFTQSLMQWLKAGPRHGELAPSFEANLPRSFEAYVTAYADDIRACASAQV